MDARRELFIEALAQETEARARLRSLYSGPGQCAEAVALQNEYNEWLLREAKERLPKKVKCKDGQSARAALAKALGDELMDSMEVPFRDRATALAQEARASEKEAQDCLAKLVDSGMQAAQGEQTYTYVSHDGSYRSQGFGASGYARTDALCYKDRAEICGLSAEVVRVEDGANSSWNVVVRCADPIVDRRIVDLMRQSMKRWLQVCLRSGSNPCVFQPFMHYDQVKDYGLDYMGNEIPSLDDAYPRL